ncbi:MAG: GLPGLI family protein [Chitinophagaceae bacterium]|nr:GLPGLI family protein [Chitinophagaceae bacterium]
MNKVYLLSLVFFSFVQVHAQAVFISKGKIEYEKKVNMHKFIEDNSWTREFKDRMPVYSVTYFDLYFDSSQSLFKAGREVPDNKWQNFWGADAGADNQLYMSFNEGISTELKQVYEKKFIVQDTAINLEWRITDEVRNIAGFDCRKAVGRMFDTLYVIAFFTDQITAPLGPGPYQGLPGAILGLAFPRYYTTWFATKVELVSPVPNDLKLPQGKASKINRKELMALVKGTNDWGSEEEKQKNFWNIVL